MKTVNKILVMIVSVIIGSLALVGFATLGLAVVGVAFAGMIALSLAVAWKARRSQNIVATYHS